MFLILAQSPIFRAMFKADMKEKEDNTVEISDIDHVVFEEFLRFCYTGKFSKSLAIKLFTVADKVFSEIYIIYK